MEILSSYMDVEQSRAYIDELYSQDMKKCFHAVVELKYAVIGNNHEKGAVIEQGILTRLIQILRASDSDIPLCTEVVIVLNSLSKGLPEQALALVQAGVLPVLWEQLESSSGSSNANYIQMVLCCLRSIYRQGCATPPPFCNHKLLTTLIQFGYHPPTNQECVAVILAHACKTTEQQQQLMNAGGADLIACLLCSQISTVQLPALHYLASLCYNNNVVSSAVITKSYGGKAIPDILVTLISWDKSVEMKLAACICFTFLHRAGALSADDPKILFKTLQATVRLCRSDSPTWIRIEAAHTLASLTEINAELQRIAALTDHLIEIMAEYLKYQNPIINPSPPPLAHVPSASCRNYNLVNEWPEMVREAALRVYASLGANDECIRHQIVKSVKNDGLMKCIVAALTNSRTAEQLASLRCLHSLSRSVRMLRTTFQDHMVWKPLMSVMKTSSSEELIIVASSTMCNLLLEFSPSKENILDRGAIEFFCGLTRRPHPGLRLNAVWALMNMVFQSDQRVKDSVMKHLGTDQIFLLLSDSDVNILMKTLGLLRNLLSNKSHIDKIMQYHGKEIMQGEHGPEVKEQALCILANIADGDLAKSAIMSNEDILKKLMNYMVMPNVKLQIVSTFCISNLIWNTEVGALERQERLRELGVDRLLDGLLTTTDTGLFDKVKTALDQFRQGGNSWRSGLSSDSSQ